MISAAFVYIESPFFAYYYINKQKARRVVADPPRMFPECLERYLPA